MSDSVVTEVPEKKKRAVTTNRGRAKKKEAAKDALTAHKQDEVELGQAGKEEAEALAKALAELEVLEQEQEELERKGLLKTEQVTAKAAEVEKHRANLGRLADNKFGARSTRAKAYRGK
jgi:hypothetical protein